MKSKKVQIADQEIRISRTIGKTLVSNSSQVESSKEQAKPVLNIGNKNWMQWLIENDQN